MNSTRFRTVAIYAALVCGGILIAFFLIELCVRIFFPQPSRFYVADPYIRTIHKANTSIIRKGEEYTARMTTNGQGFIGDEDFTIQKPPGVVRIAALGDSFTEGYVIDYTKVYPAVLEQKLNAAPRARYQVYNFGISSTGTAHQLLTYEHYIRAYHPDILVWQFFVGNDYADNLLFQPEGTPPAETRSRLYWRTREILSNNFEAPRFILHRLERLENVKHILADLSLVSRNLDHYDEEREYPFLYDIYTPPRARSNVFANEFKRTCQLAERLYAEAKADNVRFIALVVPTQEELFPEDWRNILSKNPSMQAKEWDLQQPRRSITDCLTENRIPMVDLYQIFVSVLANGGDRMYFMQDDHANLYGQELIAEALAKRIVFSNDTL